MKKALLFILFVLGRVAARASIQDVSGANGNEASSYKIEEIAVEETLPIVKTIVNENVNETYIEDGRPFARISYSGNQLWKTFFKDESQARVLSKLYADGDISMWGSNISSIDILIKPGFIEKVDATLTKENIKYQILMKDVQKAIDDENPDIDIETDDRAGHRLTWQAYHRAADIHGYLDYLGETYPAICTLEIIGKSVQGRDIKLLKISNGKPNNKAVWMDGLIHAREWITSATVTYIINHITSNYENEPEYMKNIDWYVVPLVNPDGYEYTHTADRLWRKNRSRGVQCSGTDLNRNFGYKWGGQGTSKNPCADTYGGSGPFSEPETAAIKRFITGTQANWKAYLSFHSYGQYILYPWGYERVVPPDYRDLENLGHKAAIAIQKAGGPEYTVGPVANTLYPAAGCSDDWAKGVVKVKYSYTFELRDNGSYGFLLPANYINPTAKEALAAVRVVAEAVQNA